MKKRDDRKRGRKLRNWLKLHKKHTGADYVELLELEDRKLSEMIQAWETDPYADPDDLRYIKLAQACLRLFYLDSLTPAQIERVNPRNSERFMPFSSGAVDRNWVYREQLIQEKAWHLYELIRFRYLRRWWF